MCAGEATRAPLAPKFYSAAFEVHVDGNAPLTGESRGERGHPAPPKGQVGAGCPVRGLRPSSCACLSLVAGLFVCGPQELGCAVMF